MRRQRGFTRGWRKAAVATLLGVAALALSGCWGVYNDLGGNQKGGHPYYVTVHQRPTDDWIHLCDDDPGTIGEARCVLDLIRGACSQTPIGWPIGECLDATEHWYTTCRTFPPAVDENCAEAMKRAIYRIRHEQGQCLTYEAYIGGPSKGWYTAGNQGC